MNIDFIKQINEYVIEATLEVSDDKISSKIGHANYPTWEDIHSLESFISGVVTEKRQQRLKENRAVYLNSIKDQDLKLRPANTAKTIPQMLTDIVAVMQDKDRVPKGLLVAFREQGQDGNEGDIKELWQTLVELGLIEIDDDQ